MRKLVLFLILSQSGLAAQAANLEGGLQAGLSVIRNTLPEGTEANPGLGLWVLLWPNDQIALSADWLYVWRDEFVLPRDGSTIGERLRNRQYVDVTLQYHFLRHENTSVYAEVGGGALWNNREVVNPGGLPSFPEQGPETSLKGMWTLGFGARTRLAPHLNWMGGLKVHNLADRDGGGVRLVTGLVLSWR